MKYLKFIFLAVVLTISCDEITNSKYDKYIEEEFSLEFSGIVSRVKTIEYSYGVLCLSNIVSSKKTYTEEIDNKYLCKVSNDFAKIIIITNQFKLGDSIVVNTLNNKMVHHYRDGILLKKTTINFPHGNFKRFFREANLVDCSTASASL